MRTKENGAFTFSSVQWLSHIRLFATPWTAVHQASLSLTNCWSLLKLMSIKSVMQSNHLALCHPLLFLPSIFPSKLEKTGKFSLPAPFIGQVCSEIFTFQNIWLISETDPGCSRVTKCLQAERYKNLSACTRTPCGSLRDRSRSYGRKNKNIYLQTNSFL